MDADKELVDFLLEETGDSLYIVVKYDADRWRFLFVRDTIRKRIDEWMAHADEIIQEFRREALQNDKREVIFGVGSFYCSLHLFDELIVLHFSQPAEQGIIFGYDPSAASNLTTFVDLCLPYIQTSIQPDTSTTPTWTE